MLPRAGASVHALNSIFMNSSNLRGMTHKFYFCSCTDKTQIFSTQYLKHRCRQKRGKLIGLGRDISWASRDLVLASNPIFSARCSLQKYVYQMANCTQMHDQAHDPLVHIFGNKITYQPPPAPFIKVDCFSFPSSQLENSPGITIKIRP